MVEVDPGGGQLRLGDGDDGARGDAATGRGIGEGAVAGRVGEDGAVPAAVGEVDHGAGGDRVQSDEIELVLGRRERGVRGAAVADDRDRAGIARGRGQGREQRRGRALLRNGGERVARGRIARDVGRQVADHRSVGRGGRRPAQGEIEVDAGLGAEGVQFVAGLFDGRIDFADVAEAARRDRHDNPHPLIVRAPVPARALQCFRTAQWHNRVAIASIDARTCLKSLSTDRNIAVTTGPDLLPLYSSAQRRGGLRRPAPTAK